MAREVNGLPGGAYPPAMLYDYTTRTAENISSMVEDAITEAEAIVDAVVAMEGPRTFANTMRPLEEMSVLMAETDGRGPFLQHAHTDEEIRDAARAGEARLKQWVTDLIFREDLYAVVAEFASTAEAEALTGESRRLLDFYLRDLRRAGHELEPEARGRAKEIRQRLIDLEVEFAKNIAEDPTVVETTREELAGLPDDFLDGLEEGEEPGTVKITMAYPDVIPIQQNAENRDLRRRVSSAYNNRAVGPNKPILSEAVALRLEMADLFGLPSWAHYRLEERMAKDPARVEHFYNDLLPRLTKKGEEEKAKMTDLLEVDTGDRDLMGWDYGYYENQLKKTEYGVDQFEIAEYFPLQQVIDGMFEITKAVFRLEYEEIPSVGAWHEDVQTFVVSDAQSGDLLGHFYLDLYPRDGKYTHAAAWPLRPARVDVAGDRVTPISGVLANYPKPTEEKPSLLQHNDVVTTFHEFGHVLHMTLSQAHFTRFSGAQTEWDFVEAPSQIMEHWCWQPDVLARFARHYETGEPIPTELVEQLAATKNLNTGLFHLRQCSFGMLDLTLHGEGQDKDLDQINRDTYAIGLLPFPEGTFMPASFGHIMAGYDANYYGYMWSKVFGDDMFSRFQAEGSLNPDVGTDYRRKVLEPNGTKDGDVLLRDFLGREPNNEAFLRYNDIA